MSSNIRIDLSNCKGTTIADIDNIDGKEEAKTMTEDFEDILKDDDIDISTHPLIKEDDYKTLDIYETTDYDKFVFIKMNRDVKPAHVEKLRKSLVDYGFLHFFPMICRLNEDGTALQIIAGQHRFKASRLAKVPLRYIVLDRDTSLKTISHILLVEHGRGRHCDWTDEQFASLYTTLGDKYYKELIRFSTEFDIPINISVQFIYGFDEAGKCRIKKPTERFKNGKFSFDRREIKIARAKAMSVTYLLEYTNNFKNLKYPKTLTATKAIYLFISHKNYDSKKFKERWDAKGKLIDLSGELAEILIRLCNYYNGNRKKGLINYEKIEKSFRRQREKNL